MIAIPYVRQKYGSQFPILQLNSIVLILHFLSLADMLCSAMGPLNTLLVRSFFKITIILCIVYKVSLHQRGWITTNFFYYVGLFTLFCCTYELGLTHRDVVLSHAHAHV